MILGDGSDEQVDRRATEKKKTLLHSYTSSLCMTLLDMLTHLLVWGF